MHSTSLREFPHEIAINILLHCDSKTLCAASRVCKTWHSWTSDLFLWRKTYLAEGHRWNQPMTNWWSDSGLDLITTSNKVANNDDAARRKSFLRSRNADMIRSDSQPPKQEYHGISTNLNPPLPSSAGLLERADRTFPLSSLVKNHMTVQGERFVNWKYLCGQRVRLDENWSQGSYHVRRLEGHTKGVYTIQFDETKVVSGSRDDTIKIWDIKTGQCHQTLRGHRGSILCLQYDDLEIVSGSSDFSIRVWDLSTGRHLRSLEGHRDSVLGLRFDEKRIVSCSIDRTIKVWSRNTEDDDSMGDITSPCLLTLHGHRAAVNAVQFHNDLVISASGDRTIRLWSMATGTCHSVLEGHTRGIACLHYSPKTHTFLTGSSDHSVKVWDVRSGAECTLSGHSRLVRTVHYDDGYKVVSGSYDQTVKVWDLRMGRVVTDLKDGHTSNVFKVVFNESKIVSSGHERGIVIWDFGRDVDTTFLV